jgi:hypothetical protein
VLRCVVLRDLLARSMLLTCVIVWELNTQMQPPTFRITREKENRMRLHYLPGSPNRKGFSPLVVGTYMCVCVVYACSGLTQWRDGMQVSSRVLVRSICS